MGHCPQGKVDLETVASLPESLPPNPDVSGPIPLELAAQVRQWLSLSESTLHVTLTVESAHSFSFLYEHALSACVPACLLLGRRRRI